MRTLLCAIASILLITPLSTPPAGEKPSGHTSSSVVSGEIRLAEGKSGRTAKDGSGAVVWLVPSDIAASTPLPGRPRQTYRMVQHDKQFLPHLLVVPLGSVVSFPNLDPWFHNVFSLYRGKRFDLGLYEAGSRKEVRFDRLGASYIFCNIHPEMMAVVLTVDSHFYIISDKAGHWSIPDVPRGRYRLHVWYENAAPDALQALGRAVEVGDDGATVAALRIPVAPQDWRHHSNLYGHEYDSKALAPVY